MSNPVLKAKVKKDGRVIQVYKLASGGYQIFLDDRLTVEAINQKEHWECFTKEELEILN